MSLTISFTANNKTYDGLNTVLGGTATITGGLNTGDTVTVTYNSGATFGGTNVGTYSISASASNFTLGGADASSYTIGTIKYSGTAAITTKSITVSSVTASNKTYDGDTDADVTLVYSGLVGSETLTETTIASFNNKNVGTNKTVTVGSVTVNDGTNGEKADNYTLSASYPTPHDITAKSLTVTVGTASNKTYDGNTTATTTVTLSNFVGTETVTATVTSAFSDKNVGSGKTVTISAITLADGTNGGLAANYTTPTGQTTTTAVIHQQNTSATASASNKTYDKSNATATTTVILLQVFMG